jgi:protein O-mannosyl-transferase
MDRIHSKHRTAMVSFILVAVTLAAYWPVWQNGFVSYDDRDYITENPHVLTGWTRSSVEWAFSTGYAGNWHPLTWLSHMAGCVGIRVEAGVAPLG